MNFPPFSLMDLSIQIIVILTAASVSRVHFLWDLNLLGGHDFQRSS